MASLFDTLAFSRKLQKNSFSIEQSDALADAVHEAVRGAVATKSDLDLAKSDLELSMEKVRTDLEPGMEKVRAEMAVMRWMLTVTSGGVVALVLKAFL